MFWPFGSIDAHPVGVVAELALEHRCEALRHAKRLVGHPRQVVCPQNSQVRLVNLSLRKLLRQVGRFFDRLGKHEATSCLLLDPVSKPGRQVM